MSMFNRGSLHAFTSHRDDCLRYFAYYSIRGDERRQIKGHLEIAHHRKPISCGIKFHIGNRGSETPIDGHLDLGWIGFYWGFNAPGLGALCERIGRGHKRDIYLRIHDKTFWWSLWHDDDMGYDREAHRCDKWREPKLWPWSAGRKKYRGWMCLRDGNIDINPVSAFYGKRLWLKDEDFPSQTVTALVPIGDFEGDEYSVAFTLERREVRRQHGPAWARRVKRVDFSADADSRPGIPVRNHDWKGDEILGWNIKVSAEAVAISSWVQDAVAGTVSLVRRDRKRYGYQAPEVTA